MAQYRLVLNRRMKDKINELLNIGMSASEVNSISDLNIVAFHLPSNGTYGVDYSPDYNTLHFCFYRREENNLSIINPNDPFNPVAGRSASGSERLQMWKYFQPHL